MKNELSLSVTEFNEEVLYSNERVTKVTTADITVLKKIASQNRRNRVRLCTHKNAESNAHDMLIVHGKEAYVRPHLHISRDESFHVIEGELFIVIFYSSGDIEEVIKMKEYGSEHSFYYRVPQGVYHSVIPLSDTVVFHEATSGPFNPLDTNFPVWAPSEQEHEACASYQKLLEKQVTEKINELPLMCTQ
jgi:cupin fold WbuC family metalloprotein